ncbi:acetylornithine deacetylase [Pyruvatibacter sp.]|uniref:acetylornithine deacetylase n=1 Tax=Pyruvatibacter sp. TaxID=1981328 RepID=UPI0032EACD07
MAETPPLKSADLLAALVAFDTTSHLSNLALIDYVTGLMDAYGMRYQVLPNETGTKANLYGTIGGDGPGGIVLSGHTDVVPVADQDWTTDPFTLDERDGRYYGRGTCDMKGFVACALAQLPRLSAARLTRPVHFAFSYDEEIGCLGVRPMIDHLAQHLPRPDLVIVGEPTDMAVVDAHKAIRSFRVEVTGLEYHSSQTDKGVNAIVAAAKMISFLDGIAEEMRRRGDATGRFSPPYSSLSVGRITGGTATNIVPRHCWFTFEHRTLPDQDEDEISARLMEYVRTDILPPMRDVHPGADVSIRTLAQAPGLRATGDASPLEAAVMMLAGTNERQAVSYATEAGLFQDVGIPTLVCGPGSILQAHKPDEWLAQSQLEACDAFLSRLVDHISA